MKILRNLLFFSVLQAAQIDESIKFIDFKKAILENDMAVVDAFVSSFGQSDLEFVHINVDGSLSNLTYEMYAFHNNCTLDMLKYLLNSSKNIFNLDSNNHSIVFYFGNYCLNTYSESLLNFLAVSLTTSIAEKQLLIQDILSHKKIIVGAEKKDLILVLNNFFHKLKKFQNSLDSDLHELQKVLPEVIYLNIKNMLVDDVNNKISHLILLFERNINYFSCLNPYMKAVIKNDMSDLNDLFKSRNSSFFNLDENLRTVFYYLSLNYQDSDTKMLDLLCEGCRDLIQVELESAQNGVAMETFFKKLCKFNYRLIVDMTQFYKCEEAKKILNRFHKFIIRIIKYYESKINLNIIPQVGQAIKVTKLRNPISIAILNNVDLFEVKELVSGRLSAINDIEDDCEHEIQYFDGIGPVLIALFLKKWDIVELLLRYGASFNGDAGVKYLSADALLVAIASHDLNIVEKLCQYLIQDCGLKRFILSFILKRRYAGVLGDSTVSNNMLEILQNAVRFESLTNDFEGFYYKVLHILIRKLKVYVDSVQTADKLPAVQEMADKILRIATPEEELSLKISIHQFLSL